MRLEAAPTGIARGQRVAALVICLLLALCLGTGFYVSWGALHDAARAAHVSAGAANAYAFCVDGVLALSLASSVILRHHDGSRKYSLIVLALFSTSSLVLNVAHGHGAFVPGAATKNWFLISLTATNAVAAIGFGSHLLVKTLQVLLPSLGASLVEVASLSQDEDTVPTQDEADVSSSSPSVLVEDEATVPSSRPVVPASSRPPTPSRPAVPSSDDRIFPGPAAPQDDDVEDGEDETVESDAGTDDLLVLKAKKLDAAHRAANDDKPISRDKLRRELGIGNARASQLLQEIRKGKAA